MQNFEVQIWGGNDELVKISMFQLLQFKHAIRLELNTGMKASGGSVLAHARKVLHAPKSRISNEDFLKHIEDSIENINEQLGVSA